MKGQWNSSDGIVFIESNIPVRIACTEEQMHKIANMTADLYKQKAVMFYVVSDCVHINNY